MGKYSHLSATEMQRKIASGEIDIDDAVEIDWPDDWGIVTASESPTSNEQCARLRPMSGAAATSHLSVKIRLHNGRIYELARIPIRTDIDIEDHEVEVFYYFYKKLNKQYVHVRSPVHRAIRSSIIEELFVERVP